MSEVTKKGNNGQVVRLDVYSRSDSSYDLTFLCLCSGLTSHPSNEECQDKSAKCPVLAQKYCWQQQIKDDCCKSCGLGNFYLFYLFIIR